MISGLLTGLLGLLTALLTYWTKTSPAAKEERKNRQTDASREEHQENYEKIEDFGSLRDSG